MGVFRGILGPSSPKYITSINLNPFCQFHKKVALRLSEDVDLIQTQTIKVVPPKVPNSVSALQTSYSSIF